MSAWRHQALVQLPEHRQLIEAAPTPMALWIELNLEWERLDVGASQRLVSRYLAYARWCLSDASGPLPNDTSTAAAVAFVEHLPRREHWQYFPTWFSPSEFRTLMPHFAYHLSARELTQLQELYDHGKSR